MDCVPISISNARLDKKTVIVTGANTGLGKLAVVDLYRRGARVIMACRSITKGGCTAAEILAACINETNLGMLAVVQLDLASLTSVRKCAKKLLKDESHIDILINNAGVFCPIEQTGKEGFEIHYQVNHLGHYLFTLLLLPRLIKAKASRIINLSSMTHAMLKDKIDFGDLNWVVRPYDRFQSYYQSKLANILFTIELDRRLKNANFEHVTTYCVHPGDVATNLSRTAELFFTESELIRFNERKQFFISPQLGAETIIYCAVEESMANESGFFYYKCKVCEPTVKGDRLQEANKLWDASFFMAALPEQYNPFVCG